MRNCCFTDTPDKAVYDLISDYAFLKIKKTEVEEKI